MEVKIKCSTCKNEIDIKEVKYDMETTSKNTGYTYKSMLVKCPTCAQYNHYTDVFDLDGKLIPRALQDLY